MNVLDKAARLELRDYAFSKKGVRQNKILFLLSQEKSMTHKELCKQLACSAATIRNDLRELDHLRLIKRTFGGATALDDAYGTVFMEEHLEYAHEEKRAIAEYVVNEILKPNLSVALDLGSTCLAVAQRLAKVRFDISVITNSLLNAQALARNPHVFLMLPGGNYNISADTFDTARTVEFYDRIRPDYYIMSANGVDSEGVTLTMTTDVVRAIIKQKIIQKSDKVVLVCDHNKVNKTCFHNVCDLSQIDLIVTDDMCSPEERQAFLTLGTQVVFAPMNHSAEK